MQMQGFVMDIVFVTVSYWDRPLGLWAYSAMA